MNICIQTFLCGHRFSILLGIYLGMELLIHMQTLCLIFWGPPHCFLKGWHHFTFPPAMYERYSFSTSLLPFGIVTIFYFRCSPRCAVYFIRVLICISLGTSGVEYLFIFLFAHHVFSLMKYLIFCQFSNWNLKYYYYCWVLRVCFKF